jgi:hypothetical protein
MKSKYVLIGWLFSQGVLANMDSLTWKGTYYHAKPIKPGISKQYCKEHTPGTFIHNVKEALEHSTLTDRGIKLDQATFNMDKVGKTYLIHGEITANGKTQKAEWHDRIHYFFYKYREAGTTRGVWYTNECKGLYKGIVISHR